MLLIINSQCFLYILSLFEMSYKPTSFLMLWKSFKCPFKLYALKAVSEIGLIEC